MIERIINTIIRHLESSDSVYTFRDKNGDPWAINKNKWKGYDYEIIMDEPEGIDVGSTYERITEKRLREILKEEEVKDES